MFGVCKMFQNDLANLQCKKKEEKALLNSKIPYIKNIEKHSF